MAEVPVMVRGGVLADQVGDCFFSRLLSSASLSAAPSPPFSGLPVLLTALSASEAGGVKSSKAVRLPWWLVIDVSGGVVGISGAPATPSTPPPSMPPCLAATFDV